MNLYFFLIGTLTVYKIVRMFFYIFEYSFNGSVLDTEDNSKVIVFMAETSCAILCVANIYYGFKNQMNFECGLREMLITQKISLSRSNGNI